MFKLADQDSIQVRIIC